MSGYQFIHLETYGFEKRKSSTKRWTIPEVFAEARRDAEASLHVDAPEVPSYFRNLALLNGGNQFPMADTLPRLEELIKERMAISKDTTGRKIRRDAQVLLAGVVSYPVAVLDLDHTTETGFENWRHDVFAFLDKEFGASNLAVVVEHRDERFPHLHFYVIPPASETGFSIKSFHPGLHAQDIERQRMDKSLSAKEQKKILDVAYCNAMREFQNRFHDAVSVHHGQTRLGPRKRRLTREQWKAEQTQAAALSAAVEQGRMVAEQNEREKAIMAKQKNQLSNRIITGLFGKSRDEPIPEKPTKREIELQEQVTMLKKCNTEMQEVIFKQLQESPDQKMKLEIAGLKRQNELLLVQIRKLKSEIQQYIAESNSILERFLAALPSGIREAIESWEKKLVSRSTNNPDRNGNAKPTVQNSMRHGK